MIIFSKEEEKIIESFSEIDEKNFKNNILSIIGSWKINNKNNYDYLIMQEAFNWKRLAVKIIDSLEFDKNLTSKLINWLFNPHLYATFSEKKFRELIGFEKYNAHLSYFYGVTIERCIIAYSEEELLKRQISYGNFVRYRPEDVYSHIYNITYNELIDEFFSKFKIDSKKISEIEFENFTYWCFKKRIENSEPSKLASDTKKGTMFLYKFLESENKRLNSKKNIRKKNIDFVF
tara:strand:+ start:22877 stop:23575 length:699 start_codon:yes stop_codon:yes gene_type:complete